MVSRKELKQRAKEQLKGKWGISVLITLLKFIVFIILGSVSEKYVDREGLSSGIDILSILIRWIISVAVVNFFLQISRWENVKFKDVFADITIIGKTILVNLLTVVLFIPLIIIAGIIVGVVLYGPMYSLYLNLSSLNYLNSYEAISIILPYVLKVLGVLALISIPFVIIGIYFTFTDICVCEDPSRGAWECIKLSFRTMKGNFWKYIVLKLSFLGWGILACFTLGIGFLWLSPYIEVTKCNFYNEITAYKNDETESENDSFNIN